MLANCKYCVSKMTIGPDTNENDFNFNLDKAIAFALRANVQTVLITGKGEPINNLRLLENIVNRFEIHDLIIELQTKIVTENDLQRLVDKELFAIDVFAVSVDNMNQLSLVYKLRKEYPASIIRVTFNVHDGLYQTFANNTRIDTELHEMHKNGVRQVTFRQLTVPNDRLRTDESDEAAAYIKNNTKNNLFEILNEFLSNHKVIRKLNFGPSIYDVDGLAVSSMDYCIQDSHSDENIRSLIYHSDGHMYTSWNSLASILW